MITRLSVDRIALSAVLVPVVKEQARIRHLRDDALILAHVAASIALVERLCNVSLNPAEYIVSADEVISCQALRTSPTRWLMPLNNVREFVISDGADPATAVDISAGFRLWSPDFGGNASSYLESVNGGVIPWAGRLTLRVGLEDAEELSPSFMSLIARMAASMYENREASADLLAGGFTAEILAMWRPTT